MLLFNKLHRKLEDFNLKNIILITIGLLSLVLGMIGIFLPLLPTTPFVLLSAGCFSIGSPRLSEKLTRSKIFGSYLENYRYKTGVPRKAKVRAIVFLWVGLTVSMIIIKTPIIIGLLFVIGILVTIHLACLRVRED
jgi:uncharacterized membrane protein YbaN (DUF454 family)